MIFLLKVFLGFFLFTVGAFAQTDPSVFIFPQGRLELISTRPTWNTEAPISLGLHFKLQPEWHIYWKNSGDSGAAPKWTFNFENGRLRQEHWPIPERIPVAGLINFGYSHESLFTFDVEAEAKDQPLKVKVDLEFLICKVECIPYFTKLSTSVPYKEGTPLPPLELFSRFLYPTDAPPNLRWFSLSRSGFTLQTELHISSAGIKTLEIFPEHGGYFQASVPVIEPVSGNQFKIELALHDTAKENFEGSRFLLITESTSGEKKAFTASLINKVGPSLALILLWAVLGGLILNLMPCVFPVLSIKVLSFLGADLESAEIKKSGWFYTLGVILTFTALGGALLILRSAGEQIGWGFQLQSPFIAAGIALLFFWLALNFLGLYEIGQSLSYLGAKKTQHSLWGSFLTGVLAVIVATPCTAPFMGAALGASLTLPALSTLWVFAGLGIGMALPFLLLSYMPKALAFLPKPGAWMKTFKEFLSFPLLATVLWLYWVISKQTQSETIFYLMSLMLLVSFSIWICSTLKSERTRQVLLLLFFVLSFSALAWMPAQKIESSSTKKTDLWQIYSREAVTAALERGQAVFIDFTAAWCITCQVNKKLVLNTNDIQSLFQKNEVVLFKADWTDKDPLITQALESYGRSSLPLYVYYAKGSTKPQILPEILTTGIIHNLFTKETEP